MRSIWEDTREGTYESFAEVKDCYDALTDDLSRRVFLARMAFDLGEWDGYLELIRCSGLMPEEEIFSFYQELFRLVSAKPFLLYYLYDPDPEPHLRQICRERSDNEGNQLWYPLMMQYLAAAPYGKKYGCSTFDDLLACLKRRQELELRLIREILKDRAVILPAKRYTMQDLEWMEGK